MRQKHQAERSTVENMNRTGKPFDISDYSELLEQARTAFLQDTAYAVAIAETYASSRAASESSKNPHRADDDIVRLHRQGAGVPEISRIVHRPQYAVRAVLSEAGLDANRKPQERAGRSSTASSARSARREDRPVHVRWVEPRRVTEQPVPEPAGDVVDPVAVDPVPVKPPKSQHEDNRCPAGHKHGATGTCFKNHFCRCPECKERARATRAEQRAKQRARK